MPPSRPATVRTQSVSPLFSWITSTAPLGAPAAAQAACSSPRGPGQVIGVVSMAFSMPGGSAFGVSVFEVTAPVDVAGASVVGLLPPPHAAIHGEGGGGAAA